MECPDETVLTDFLEGLLAGAQLEGVQAHLDGCDGCRKTVAGMAQGEGGSPTVVGAWDRTFTSDPADARGQRAAWSVPRGTSINRYVVLDEVGAGGMGVVFAAYDPELNRKVAIKLLRPDKPGARGERAAARLLREAQALARLSHSNVVAVHDVGAYEGSVFIAMDYVDGSTLTEWLAERPRSWGEVLEVFIAAGRGLVAAHAAGLVHRDFKPDNVLVSTDGQVRVTDFGLARPAPSRSMPDEDEEPDWTASTAVQVSAPHRAVEEATDPFADVTRTDVAAGTVPYMAPEQIRGAAPDARSDQFSYCVALYEGLYGERPFQGGSVHEVTRALMTGQISEPSRPSRVPARLRRAVLRGLRPEPLERHPSMSALLDALEKARGVRLRRPLLLAVGMAVVVAASLAGYASARRSQPLLCTGAELQLAGIWDAERKATLRAAFLATGKPFAESAWESAAHTLDGYADGWVRMQTEACEATRVRGQQSDELLGLRTACLDRRLRELKALTTLFAQADAMVVQRAPSAARGLEGLSGCADLSALSSRAHPPDAPELRARVEALRDQLMTARALQKTGKYAEALVLAQKAASELQGVGYLPARAEASYLVGQLQLAQAQPRAAEQTLYRALFAAEGGRDDALAARAWLSLIGVVGVELARPAEGQRLAQVAEAALVRLGPGRAPALEAELHASLGALHRHAGEQEQAVAEFQRALSILERELGPEDPEVAAAANRLGYVLAQQGKYPEAVTQIERALAILRKAFGADHPEVATSLTKLGLALGMEGRLEEARGHLSEALAIGARTVGPDHPSNAEALQYLAYFLVQEGKSSEAVEPAGRAVEIMRRTYGKAHPDTAVMVSVKGIALDRAGRLDEAIDCYLQALRVFQKAYPADHPNTVEVLANLGQAELERRRAADARKYLERALKLSPAGKGGPAAEDKRAQTRFALARALWESGGDRARARALAAQARAGLGALEPPRAREVAEITVWLARHGGGERARRR